MPRGLDITTLDNAARFIAVQFQLPTLMGRRGRAGPARGGREWALQTLYNATHKDEFAYLLPRVRDELARRALAEFDDEAGRRFTLRTDETLRRTLCHWLAIDPDGNHVKGVRGRVEIGRRPMGRKQFEIETPDSIRRRKRLGLALHVPGRTDRETMLVWRNWTWPIYAGEGDERAAGAGPEIVDPLPPGTPPLPVGALNTRISNEAAIAACDAVVDRLDEGTTAATLRGRSGAQPAGVDELESGTLLFTLTGSDPVFGAAVDANPGGRATADPVTDDSSADATGTLGYCRAGATGTGADDHIDGEAGTSGADFNFSTLSIVAGGTVSLTSWTVTHPES